MCGELLGVSVFLQPANDAGARPPTAVAVTGVTLVIAGTSVDRYVVIIPICSHYWVTRLPYSDL